MSDKKNIDNRKIIAVMCVALAFFERFYYASSGKNL